MNYQEDIDEVAGNKAETNKKPVLWQETAEEVNIQQQQLLVPHSSLGLMNATVSKPWMRIDELPKRQSSLYGGIKPNTWPPPYLTEAHIQRLTDLMEKDHLEIEQAMEVLGIVCKGFKKS